MVSSNKELRYCRQVNIAQNDEVEEHPTAVLKIAVTVRHHAGWGTKELGERLTFALRDDDAKRLAEELTKLVQAP